MDGHGGREEGLQGGGHGEAGAEDGDEGNGGRRGGSRGFGVGVGERGGVLCCYVSMDDKCGGCSEMAIRWGCCVV
jgi:hypothetical protein